MLSCSVSIRHIDVWHSTEWRAPAGRALANRVWIECSAVRAHDESAGSLTNAPSRWSRRSVGRNWRCGSLDVEPGDAGLLSSAGLALAAATFAMGAPGNGCA